MSLLSIVQSAASRLNLPVPLVVIANVDETVVQLLELSNEEGRELSKRATWQRLNKEQVFTSVATETQTGAIPADFERILPDTFFNRTRKRQVLGPLSPQDWQAQKGITATVIYDSYRIRGNDILMLPVPPAGDIYAYEYMSTKWVDTDADGIGDAATWTADTNTSILNEELLTLGVVWRFLKAKGLDYADHFQQYDMQVSQAVARDGGRTSISMAQDMNYNRPRYPGVPEGSWNV